MRAAMIVSAVMSLAALSGCNTMQGLGTDITNLGNSLNRAATQGKIQAAPARTENPGDARVQPNYPVQPLESRELQTMPYEKYDEGRPPR